MRKFLPAVILSLSLLLAVSVIPNNTLRADEVFVIPETGDSEPKITSETAQSYIEKAGKELRSHLLNYETSIEIDTTGCPPVTTDDEAFEISWAIRNKAIEHTGDPDEGDYLKLSTGSITVSSRRTSSELYDLKYTVTYNSTFDQAKEAAKKSDQIFNSLNLDGKSDYEKIKAIYDYLTSNITYDFSALEKDNPLAHSAYAAFVKKTSVCQGISLAAYRLMLKAGIDCRIVEGTLNGRSHSWNIVKLDGKYYFIDATNDLGAKPDYRYFLKCLASLPDHSLYNEFKSDEFKKAYPLATSDYKIPDDDPAKSDPTATPKPTTAPDDGKEPGQAMECDVITVTSGDTKKIKITYDSDAPPKRWKSSNTDVVSVDSKGNITAKMAGHALVRVDLGSEISLVYPINVLYKDVTSKDDFWYGPTYYLTYWGVVRGYDKQTKFKPANKCTRAQMVTFIWRLQGEPEPKSTTCKFSDVNKSDYFYKACIWGNENHIVEGYKDGTFGPQIVCARKHAVTFLWRLAEKPEPKSSENKFSDVKKGDYFYKATIWASEMGILAGYNDGTFRPNGDCLRRQMVTFLYKYDIFVNKKSPDSGWERIWQGYDKIFPQLQQK